MNLKLYEFDIKQVTATPPQILPSVMAASSCSCQKKGSFQEEESFLIELWIFFVSLIETLCVACGILGRWQTPRNPQNVIFFLPPSFSRSLSLLLCFSSLPLFFPMCRGVLHQPSESWWRQLTEREWASNSEQGLDCYIQPPASHWNNLKPSVNKWFETKKKQTLLEVSHSFLWLLKKNKTLSSLLFYSLC